MDDNLSLFSIVLRSELIEQCGKRLTCNLTARVCWAAWACAAAKSNPKPNQHKYYFRLFLDHKHKDRFSPHFRFHFEMHKTTHNTFWTAHLEAHLWERERGKKTECSFFSKCHQIRWVFKLKRVKSVHRRISTMLWNVVQNRGHWRRSFGKQIDSVCKCVWSKINKIQ